MKKTERKKSVGTLHETVLDSISEAVMTVDGFMRLTYMNRAAEKLTGLKREKVIGKTCSEILEGRICEAGCAIQSTLKTLKSFRDRPAAIINSSGKRLPVSMSTSILRDASGTVRGVAASFRDTSDIEELRKELDAKYSVSDIVSRSPAMKKIFEMLPLVAASETTVLITGETGTGKELLARAIHNEGVRKNAPFIAVNCGALPENLMESELFGYKAGAFTGAGKDKPGRFAAAEGGTLFLDEVGELSPALQVKLLRVLQEKTYEMLGSNKVQKADVRIIAATNRNLEAMIQDSRFRQDLYYRLNVLKMELPPLRKRREDIPVLLEHFIAKFSRKTGKGVKNFSPEFLHALKLWDFPGNIRELENIVEYAFVLCQTQTLELSQLPDYIIPESKVANSEPFSISTATNDAARKTIIAALEKHSWNRIAAARELGMSKSTFFRKIRTLKIELPDNDGRYKVS